MNAVNISMSREKLLKKLQSHALALHETALFLDTHPHSKSALRYFAKMKEAVILLTAEYEEKYGPLEAFSTNAENGWGWIDAPWPWQNEDSFPVKLPASNINAGCDTSTDTGNIGSVRRGAPLHAMRGGRRK